MLWFERHSTTNIWSRCAWKNSLLIHDQLILRCVGKVNDIFYSVYVQCLPSKQCIRELKQKCTVDDSDLVHLRAPLGHLHYVYLCTDVHLESYKWIHIVFRRQWFGMQCCTGKLYRCAHALLEVNLGSVSFHLPWHFDEMRATGFSFHLRPQHCHWLWCSVSVARTSAWNKSFTLRRSTQLLHTPAAN